MISGHYYIVVIVFIIIFKLLNHVLSFFLWSKRWEHSGVMLSDSENRAVVCSKHLICVGMRTRPFIIIKSMIEDLRIEKICQVN